MCRQPMSQASVAFASSPIRKPQDWEYSNGRNPLMGNRPRRAVANNGLARVAGGELGECSGLLRQALRLAKSRHQVGRLRHISDAVRKRATDERNPKQAPRYQSSLLALLFPELATSTQPPGALPPLAARSSTSHSNCRAAIGPCHARTLRARCSLWRESGRRSPSAISRVHAVEGRSDAGRYRTGARDFGWEHSTLLRAQEQIVRPAPRYGIRSRSFSRSGRY